MNADSVQVNVPSAKIQEKLPQDHIDEEIAKQEAALRELKSRRNTFAPISRLPPEMLANVFVHIVNGVLPYERKFNQYAFMAVCKFWRSIAVRAPQLWSSIKLHPLPWGRLMLERSGATAINVDFSVSLRPESSPECLFLKEILRDHRCRIGRLRLVGVSARQATDLFSPTTQSFGQLRTLELQGPYSDVYNESLTNPMIPEDAFGETDLRRLTLTSWNIDWKSSLLSSGLTHLKLSAACRPDLSSFVHAIQKLTALEELELRNALPISTENIDALPAQLDNLQILQIADSFAAIFASIPLLAVPPSTAVKLEYRSGDSLYADAEDIRRSKDALASFFAIKKLTVAFRHLLIDSRVHLSCWINPVKSTPFISPTNPADLIIQVGYSQALLAIQAMPSSLPLSKLTSLDVRTTADAETWSKALGSLCSLTHISVPAESVPSFLKALVSRSKDHENSLSAYRSVSFKALKCLRIREAKFSDYNDSLKVTADSLADTLIERYERGAPIDEIHIDNCYNFYDDHFGDIADIVVDARWDGVELYHSDENNEEEEYYDGEMYDSESESDGFYPSYGVFW